MWVLFHTGNYQGNCDHSAFVSFAVGVVDIAPIYQLVAAVFVYLKVLGLFTTKEPWFRVGGSFTILVSESWKQS